MIDLKGSFLTLIHETLDQTRFQAGTKVHRRSNRSTAAAPLWLVMSMEINGRGRRRAHRIIVWGATCDRRLSEQRRRAGAGALAAIRYPAAVGMSMNGTIEDGMAAMSAKFKEMGSGLYFDAEKVKESNRVL
jgi:hypothetical protein